jgi:hypothetical protein
MGSLWSFLSAPKNQKTLGLLGAALVVAAGGGWEVFKYVWPHEEGPKIVCAQPGGIAAGRDANGNKLSITGDTQVETGAKQAPCVEAGKPQ